MSVFALLLLLAAGLVVVMTLAFLVAQGTGRSGWVDAIWTFGVGAAGVAAALIPLEGGGETTARQFVVAALAALWSLRLGGHIALRTARGSGDDPRYSQLKEEWGDAAPRRLFLFLQIQAGAGLVLAIAMLAAARNPAPGLGLLDWLGMAVMLASVIGEGVADSQLERFRKDPANKGKVCDAGLWGWSRHPNYFFEWLAWVSYVLIALNPAYPWGLAALLGPLLMYVLLVHISGIPPLEAHMERSRGAAFRAYQARVNAFFPAPPR